MSLATRSSWATSPPRPGRSARWRGSASTASTRPPGNAALHSHRAKDPPPTPASRNRHPAFTPSPRRSHAGQNAERLESRCWGIGFIVSLLIGELTFRREPIAGRSCPHRGLDRYSRLRRSGVDGGAATQSDLPAHCRKGHPGRRPRRHTGRLPAPPITPWRRDLHFDDVWCRRRGDAAAREIFGMCHELPVCPAQFRSMAPHPVETARLRTPCRERAESQAGIRIGEVVSERFQVVRDQPRLTVMNGVHLGFRTGDLRLDQKEMT